MRATTRRVKRIEQYAPLVDVGRMVQVEADESESDAVIDARAAEILGRPLQSIDLLIMVIKPVDADVLSIGS